VNSLDIWYYPSDLRFSWLFIATTFSVCVLVKYIRETVGFGSLASFVMKSCGFYRVSCYVSAVLAVVILSVGLSLCHTQSSIMMNIHHNWTFLRYLLVYGWDVISRNLKSAYFEGGGSLWVEFSDRRGRRQPATVGVGKLLWLTFRVVSKYLQCIVLFCHKECVWLMDRPTDKIILPSP